MKSQLERLASDFKTYLALLAVVSAGLGAMTDLITKFLELLRKVLPAGALPEPLPDSAKWIIVALLIVLAAVTFLQVLAKRSELKLKERFLISPSDPSHLVGREVELKRLADECADPTTSLVFLNGESGAGKSALARAGLIEYLNGNPFWTKQKSLGQPPLLYPILIDGAAVEDWDKGIGTWLRRVLPTKKEVCDSHGVPVFTQETSPWSWLASANSTGCPRPVLIMDQMDDYVQAHRGCLFREGKVVSSKSVEKESDDWRHLAELVRDRSICLVLICRADVVGFLQAFQFCEPQQPVILRVNQHTLAPLLDVITHVEDKEPLVISDPEHGWNQLRPRLLRDLSDAAGEILPIRLVVALSSLRMFRFLTPTEYQKAGRASGLERLHIERVLREASQASRISAEVLLRMLQELISADATKTQRSTLKELAASVKVKPAELRIAVKAMENEHLIRRLPGEVDDEGLMLYHDQLARGIRDAARSRDQWNLLLRERAQAFTDAIGWAAQWRSLLPLREQASILWQRLRGRLSYGRERNFAALSLVRLIPWLAAAGIATTGFRGYSTMREEQEAEHVVNALTVTTGMAQAYRRSRDWDKQSFADDWTKLANMSSHARLHAWGYVAGSPERLRTMGDLEPQLVHAVVGLEPSAGEVESLVAVLVEELHQRSRHDYRNLVNLLAAVPVSGQRSVKVITGLPFQEMLPSDPLYARNFATALMQLLKAVPTINLKPLATSLVTRMQAEPGSYSLEDLGQALGTLSAKLDKDDLKSGATSLVTRIMQLEKDSFSLGTLGEVLGTLSAKLDEDDIKPLATSLVTRMQTEKERGSLARLRLGEALGTLSAKLDKDDLKPGATSLVTRMQTEQDIDLLARLCEALGKLSAKLDKDDLKPGAISLVNRMRTEQDSDSLARLGGALGRISAKLDQDDLKPGATSLIIRMQTEQDIDSLARLGEALGTLSANLDKDDLKPLATSLITRMQTEQDGYLLGTLGEVLGTLSANLDKDDLKPGITSLVTHMQTEQDSPWLFRLARVLALFATQHLLQRPQIESSLAVLFARIHDEPSQSLVEQWAQLEKEAADIDRLPLQPRVQTCLDILKLPTCAGKGREAVIAALAEMTGESFTREGDKEPDIWLVVEWAKRMNREKGWHLNLDREHH